MKWSQFAVLVDLLEGKEPGNYAGGAWEWPVDDKEASDIIAGLRSRRADGPQGHWVARLLGVVGVEKSFSPPGENRFLIVPEERLNNLQELGERLLAHLESLSWEKTPEEKPEPEPAKSEAPVEKKTRKGRKKSEAIEQPKEQEQEQGQGQQEKQEEQEKQQEQEECEKQEKQEEQEEQEEQKEQKEQEKQQEQVQESQEEASENKGSPEEQQGSELTYRKVWQPNPNLERLKSLARQAGFWIPPFLKKVGEKQWIPVQKGEKGAINFLRYLIEKMEDRSPEEVFEELKKRGLLQRLRSRIVGPLDEELKGSNSEGPLDDPLSSGVTIGEILEAKGMKKKKG